MVAFLVWQAVGNAVAAVVVELVVAVEQDVPALSCLPSQTSGHIVAAAVVVDAAAVVAEPVAVVE